MRATSLLLLSTLLVHEVSAMIWRPPLRPPTVVQVESTYETPGQFHTTLRELRQRIMQLMHQYKDRANDERFNTMLKQLEGSARNDAAR